MCLYKVDRMETMECLQIIDRISDLGGMLTKTVEVQGNFRTKKNHF